MTTSKSKTALDDLNHDPSLIETLSDADLKRLWNESESSDLPLGGNVRSRLNQRFNEAFSPAPPEE